MQYGPTPKEAKLLKQALAAYENDGDIPYRDAITDLLWLAYRRLRSVDTYSIVTRAHNMFLSELDDDAYDKEWKKIKRIPVKELPLHLHDKWRHDANKEFFLKRLKEAR